MASYLGLYIENKLIKYAKVSKNNDNTKIESFGVKFYENLSDAIDQIIQETYSFKTPICINLTDEQYNEIEAFSLLSKKDIEGVVKTEFENICYKQEKNRNAFEERHIYANDTKQNEKIKVIHISVSKTSIAQRKNQLSKYKIASMVPVSTSLLTLLKKDKKEINSNCLIINIEKNTTVTQIIKGNITKIDVIPEGTSDILGSISQKENSYAKAYEICKQATIYTEADKDLQYEENEYLDDIMPTLYKIATEVKQKADESLNTYEKVYISGTGALINNIDIYFQEMVGNIPCEVLRPGFIANTSKINIKDYMEVNSAVSIALQAMEKENKLNFIQESATSKLKNLLKSDISSINQKDIAGDIEKFFSKFEKQYNIILFTLCFLTIAYIGGSTIINNNINKKVSEVEDKNKEISSRISTIEGYTKTFNTQISNYSKLINNAQTNNNVSTEDTKYKNAIPNLLNNIMAVIPKSVQLTSIENTNTTHVVIIAKSSRYEQIAYFKTKLKVDGILENVVSDTGTSQGGTLTVTIEGELP